MKNNLEQQEEQFISASEIWYIEEDILKEYLINGDFKKVKESYFRLKDAIILRFGSIMEKDLVVTSIASIIGGIIHFACKEGKVSPSYLSFIIVHQYNLSTQVSNHHESQTMDQIMLDLLQYSCELIQQFNTPDYSFNVNKTIEYIHNHISEKISLNDIANHLKLSPQYLSTLFHQEVGKTISDYIHERKIHLAKEYLREKNLTITQISEFCGFEDPNYFSRIFKKQCGMSPREFQHKLLYF